MINSKYAEAFGILAKKGVFSTAEGKKTGIPPRMLVYFCEKGHLEKIRRGIYKIKNLNFGSEFEWEDLAVTALSVPNGVICLISALCYYHLTDEIMREFWLAVPNTTSSPVRENTRIIRMRNTSFGQTSVKIGSRAIKIFDRERTIVDAFRYLDKETALKALRTYLKSGSKEKPNIDKLLYYAKKLRFNLAHYISAFTL